MNRIAKPTPFFSAFDAAVAELGGMFNAHLHLDRALTLDDRYMADAQHRILQSSHVSLKKKHGLIHALHAGPAFEPDDLRRRVDECLDVMVACNTRRADTLVDVTADRVGLTALEVMRSIQRERAGEIDLRLGAYTPFGFVDDEPERWDVFVAGAQMADFIAGLPEADDTDDYPGHIGFEEHCSRLLLLARDLGLPLHVHTDQVHADFERGTERLVAVMREVGSLPRNDDAPAVWAVHAISPATYEQGRFEALVEGLLETDVGIICCPSAALGMRQLRPLTSPTCNSIPRVLELIDAGVHVRLASDNIADICSPSTTADLTDEVLVLSAAIRFYDVGVLARLAVGQPLSEEERARVRDHLERNEAEVRKVLRAKRAEAVS